MRRLRRYLSMDCITFTENGEEEDLRIG